MGFKRVLHLLLPKSGVECVLSTHAAGKNGGYVLCSAGRCCGVGQGQPSENLDPQQTAAGGCCIAGGARA